MQLCAKHNGFSGALLFSTARGSISAAYCLHHCILLNTYVEGHNTDEQLDQADAEPCCFNCKSFFEAHPRE